ncbi:fungal specific transcription factor [Colletotrichum tofieldiae]|uniref:Fungal specific transcription factor n=1 Tax=Colletotrichum tofieldiae TaxID=708197 RepID=A0A166T3W0_9PEZI|nr:fungal specific transcription factor [Colletotrichum tofieldiae]
MEPKPKRIKIDVACEACRRRKVKCDGARPACGNCSKRTDLRNECTYSSEANEKSFSREKTANASPRSPRRAMPKIMHTPDASFKQPPMPPISHPPPNATPKSTVSSGPDLARRSRIERHPITPSDASPSVVDSMTTVREDGMVTGSQADYVLPPRKQADHLMDLYWYYVDPLYPFLDQQRFEHSYRALFAGTSIDADERIFVSILNIIFALSTQLIESMSPEQRDSTSQGYFTRAQDLLQLSLWDTGSIELIQCLLIMSQYLQSTNNPHQTWMIVGSAVRIAQGLGLHLPETSLELSSDSERDLVKRIWHGCLLMDRMIAITHGRPAMISDQLASSVVLPSIPDTSNDTGNEVQLDTVSLHRLRYQGFFHKSLELYEVINHAVLAFYSSASPLRSPVYPIGVGHSSQRPSERPELDLGKALQLDQRLTKWEKSLPSFLTMAEPETTLDEVFRRQAVILRIRLLHARMLLLRPMLACFCLSQSPETSQAHDGLSSRVVQQCAMVCVEAAQSLISFIVQHQRHDGSLGLLPAWWYRVFYIYTAATVLIAARLRPAVFSSLDIPRSWNQAMGLLHDHENLGPSPRRCAAALQILSTKMFQDQQPQPATLPNSEVNQEVPHVANDQQETFDMPFSYLAQDTDFDLDAIAFDVNDFSWLNSMPGSFLLILTSTTSLSTKYFGGFIPMPTPDGVPVNTTVPASKVVPWLIKLTISSTPNSKSPVLSRCLSSPLTKVCSRRSLAFPTTAGDTSTGLKGANLSKPLLKHHWGTPPAFAGSLCQALADTSLAVR